MPPALSGQPSWLRVVALTPVVVSLGFALMYVACALLRVSFPWELEWMEGGMLAHAARVLRGEPIYAQPSTDFVAFFYTPLYSYLVAAFASLTGSLSFGLGRAVSLLASLATMGMLFYAARREAGVLAGLLAVGLYAALFRTCGAFYDLARADSLSLAIALAGCLIAYYAPTRRAAALAAALFVLAFLTKQTTAIMAPFVGLYLLTVDWRRALLFGVTGIGLGLGSGLALDAYHEGWFRFYTVEGHQGHLFLWGNFLLEYFRDVLFLSPFLWLVPALGASYGKYARWLVLPFLVLLAFAFKQRVETLHYEPHMYYRELWYEEPRSLLIVPPLAMAVLLLTTRVLRRSAPPPGLFFLLLALAGALASDLNHSTQWAYSNCFMPLSVFGSLYAAITFGRLLPTGTAPRERAALITFALALLVQLVALGYDPRAQVPNQADRAALASVERILAAYPGPVFMPAHPLYSYWRDGSLQVHQMGLGDVGFAGGVGDLGARLARGLYPTVVVDEYLSIPGLEQSYVPVHSFRFEGSALLSKTGFMVRPATLWLHRSVKERPLIPPQ